MERITKGLIMLPFTVEETLIHEHILTHIPVFSQIEHNKYCPCLKLLLSGDFVWAPAWFTKALFSDISIAVVLKQSRDEEQATLRALVIYGEIIGYMR